MKKTNKYVKSLVNIASQIDHIVIGDRCMNFLYSPDYANINELVELYTTTQPTLDTLRQEIIDELQKTRTYETVVYRDCGDFALLNDKNKGHYELENIYCRISKTSLGFPFGTTLSIASKIIKYFELLEEVSHETISKEIDREKIKAFDLIQKEYVKNLVMSDLGLCCENIMEVSNETIFDLLKEDHNGKL